IGQALPRGGCSAREGSAGDAYDNAMAESFLPARGGASRSLQGQKASRRAGGRGRLHRSFSTFIPEGPGWTGAVLPDGGQIASSVHDKTVAHTRDAMPSKEIAVPFGHEGFIDSIAFSPASTSSPAHTI